MKFRIIRVAKWFITLNFYAYLLFIPLYWFIMLGEYFDGQSDRIMITQIQHGPLLKAGPDPHAEVEAGKPFALAEETATIWVKSESVAHYIFFSRIGDRNGFGWNFITLLFGLAIVYLLKRIFDSIYKGGIFTTENAMRIKQIGWLIIGKYVYLILISYWMNDYLQQFDLPYEWARGHSPEASDLYLGILLLCIGQVYKEGVKMKQEAELVI